jgi:hypothetical protein
VLDADTVAQRLEEVQRGFDELHREALRSQQARCDDAQDALRRAAVAVADAEATQRAARAEVARLDALEAEIAQAEMGRDEAGDAEADELQKVSGVLRRRQRLSHQRREAASALAQLRVSGPERPSAELRRQVAGIEAALARAEAEQAQAERQVEEALSRARDLRLASVAALEQADATIRKVIPDAITSSWPPGPPLASRIAEYRARLMSGVAEAEARAQQAKEAQDAAGLHAEAQQHALARTIDERRVAERAELFPEWLHPDSPLVAGADLLLIDEAFSESDLEVVGPALEQLSAAASPQTLYLTDEPTVLSWAIELPHAVGGISGLVRSGGPSGRARPSPSIQPSALAS